MRKPNIKLVKLLVRDIVGLKEENKDFENMCDLVGTKLHDPLQVCTSVCGEEILKLYKKIAERLYVSGNCNRANKLIRSVMLYLDYNNVVEKSVFFLSLQLVEYGV